MEADVAVLRFLMQTHFLPELTQEMGPDIHKRNMTILIGQLPLDDGERRGREVPKQTLQTRDINKQAGSE